MPRLIFFTGHSGTGKTTLSKQVVPRLHARTGDNFAFLDKDTLYGDYSSRVMQLLTGDPHDRDSPTFLEHLREPEYDGLLATARENLEIGVNVVVCAPFSREVKSGKLFDAQAMGMSADTRISVVWLTLAEEEARRRIEARGHPRDRYKLAHWDEYRVRRFEPAAADYPQMLLFDTTIFTDANLDAMVEWLAGR